MDDSTDAFQKNGCNMIIWGKWKSSYEEPIELHIHSEDKSDQQSPSTQAIKECIIEMISAEDCCLFLTESGLLYAMGQSVSGMLGLGENQVKTGTKARKVEISGDLKVIDIKAGSQHVLALTEDGQVFGWGSNQFGQVGCIKQSEDIVWKPLLIYPLPGENNQNIATDPAIQIQTHEDSSFLVTKSGAMYSWGKNLDGFLGRQTSQIIGNQVNPDSTGLNPLQNIESQNRPFQVKKLEKFNVQRLAINEGKIMVFFVPINQVNEDDQSSSSSSESESSHQQDSTIRTESQFDFEEEKDVVVGNFGKQIKNKKIIDSRSNYSSKKSSSRSTQSSKQIVSHIKSHNDKDLARRYQMMNEALKKTCDIRNELERFDRSLADSIRPLAEIENKCIYHDVIDKFATGQGKSSDVEELRNAIDKVQVQLKSKLETLTIIEHQVTDTLKLQLELKHKEFKDSRQHSLEDEALFQELKVLVELLTDSINLKKLNLVGCKMKIYQERMKELNFLELVTVYRDYRDDQNDEETLKINLERQMYLLSASKQLSKKTQASLKKNVEHYMQLHVGCSVPTSLAMSALTNSVFVECDLWRGLGSVTHSAATMQSRVQVAEQSNDKIRKLWLSFQQLQETDFNKKVEKYQDRQASYESTKDWFDAIMREIHGEIKEVLSQVRIQMKENNRKGDNKDILFFFQTLIHDAALIRQLLFSAQQALFEGAQIPMNQSISFEANKKTINASPQQQHRTLNKNALSAQGGSVKSEGSRFRNNSPGGSSIQLSQASQRDVRHQQHRKQINDTPNPNNEGGGITGFITSLFGSGKK